MKVTTHSRLKNTTNQAIPCPLCRAKRYEAVISSATQMHAQKKTFSFVRCTACGYLYLNPPVPPHASVPITKKATSLTAELKHGENMLIWQTKESGPWTKKEFGWL